MKGGFVSLQSLSLGALVVSAGTRHVLAGWEVSDQSSNDAFITYGAPMCSLLLPAVHKKGTHPNAYQAGSSWGDSHQTPCSLSTTI